MAKVEIKIVAKPTTDIYTRYHGKAIDEVLPLDWYKEGEASKYYIKTSKEAFEHVQTVDLAPGKHTIYYSPASTAEGYYWEAEVFVNGQSLGVQSDLWYKKQYVAEFEVKATLEDVIASFASTFINVMMLVLVISLLTSVLKGIRKK
jgi:hypothetical protein